MPKPEIIKALLKAGADVNAKLGEEWSEKDTSALYRAVEGDACAAILQPRAPPRLHERPRSSPAAKMTAAAAGGCVVEEGPRLKRERGGAVAHRAFPHRRHE